MPITRSRAVLVLAVLALASLAIVLVARPSRASTPPSQNVTAPGLYPTFVSGYGTVGATATNLGVDLGTTSCTAGPGAPFTTTPERVADAVAKGLANGKEIVWAPGILRWVFTVFRHLPRAVWRRVPG